MFGPDVSENTQTLVKGLMIIGIGASVITIIASVCMVFRFFVRLSVRKELDRLQDVRDDVSSIRYGWDKQERKVKELETACNNLKAQLDDHKELCRCHLPRTE